MADQLSDSVAATIRAEMARHQVKQRQVADALGISVNQVSERLSGKTPFRINELGIVARLLGVPVSAFFAEAERAA